MSLIVGKIVRERAVGWGDGYMEHYVLSAQLLCKSKTVLKKSNLFNHYFKKTS